MQLPVVWRRLQVRVPVLCVDRQRVRAAMSAQPPATAPGTHLVYCAQNTKEHKQQHTQSQYHLPTVRACGARYPYRVKLADMPGMPPDTRHSPTLPSVTRSTVPEQPGLV